LLYRVHPADSKPQSLNYRAMHFQFGYNNYIANIDICDARAQNPPSLVAS